MRAIDAVQGRLRHKDFGTTMELCAQSDGSHCETRRKFLEQRGQDRERSGSLVALKGVDTSPQPTATPAQPKAKAPPHEPEVLPPEIIATVREKVGERGRNRTFNLLISFN
jgi:hypothetical protein